MGELTAIPLIWDLEMGETMGKVPWLSDDENVASLQTALITTMADDGYQELLIRLSALSSARPKTLSCS
ncbi:MAG: hypothetical protein WCE80_03565 [Acidimicrobiia bacterium]